VARYTAQASGLLHCPGRWLVTLLRQVTCYTARVACCSTGFTISTSQGCHGMPIPCLLTGSFLLGATHSKLTIDSRLYLHRDVIACRFPSRFYTNTHTHTQCLRLIRVFIFTGMHADSHLVPTRTHTNTHSTLTIGSRLHFYRDVTACRFPSENCRCTSLQVEFTPHTACPLWQTWAPTTR
jgi:hypothetical protein